MAYINPDILQEDWDYGSQGALDAAWVDQDSNNSVSSISPAGQLYLNLTPLSADGSAKRKKEIASWGTGDYYVEIRFKGDVWDGNAGNEQFGIELFATGATFLLRAKIGNNNGSGFRINNGNDWTFVKSITWGTDWNIITFFVHNGQTDVDIWINKNPRTEAADVTDADCSDDISLSGRVVVSGWGTQSGDGQYHIDYLYIGTELLPEDFPLAVTVGEFTLTGIAAGLLRGIQFVASLGTFVLTGIAVTFNLGFGIAVTVGNFALTGVSVVFTRTLIMIASVGSFALTGVTVTFKVARMIIASVGNFILTGINVILRLEWRKEGKETTSFTKGGKPTTSFTKEGKSAGSWEKQPK